MGGQLLWGSRVTMAKFWMAGVWAGVWGVVWMAGGTGEEPPVAAGSSGQRWRWRRHQAAGAWL